MLSYAFNANTDTAEQLAERRHIADMIAGRIGGATTYGGGIGDLFQGLAVGLSRYKTNKAQKAGDAKAGSLKKEILQRMLSGGAAPQNTGYAGAPVDPNDPLSGYSYSIGGQESGHNYSALGPVTKSGDRAYGYHQVMGANIPDWSEAATGQRLTPEEFLAMPTAQDKVFRDRFGGYLKDHSPEDAASMWFTGKPLAQGAGLHDQLGTSGQEYVDQFNAGLGGDGGMPMVPQLATYTPPPPQGGPEPAGGPMQPPPQMPPGGPPQGPEMGMQPAQQPVMAQMAPAGEDDSMVQLMVDFLGNGFGTDSDKAFIQQRLNSILEKRQKETDPAYKLDLEYKKAQINNLNNPHNSSSGEYGLQPLVTQEGPKDPNPGKYHLYQAPKFAGDKPRELELPYGWTPKMQFLNQETQFAPVATQGVLQPGQGPAPIPIENTKAAADTKLGTETGESAALATSLSSKMPGLQKVVEDLGVLADKATYTKTGQLWNAIRKETGMEPTEAAVARTAYMAMVNNQVLPMLRDTFGPQFTVVEGETLRSTLGDPDKTPAEKKEVLKAFIEQQTRNMEAAAKRGGVQLPPSGAGAGGKPADWTDEEWNALTPEEQAGFGK